MCKAVSYTLSPTPTLDSFSVAPIFLGNNTEKQSKDFLVKKTNCQLTRGSYYSSRVIFTCLSLSVVDLCHFSKPMTIRYNLIIVDACRNDLENNFSTKAVVHTLFEVSFPSGHFDYRFLRKQIKVSHRNFTIRQHIPIFLCMFCNLL